MSDTPWRRERHIIKCCYGCVPPKRYPGCGAHCKEYKDEKAEYKRQMEEYERSKKPALSSYDFDKVRMTASRKRK